VKLKPNFSLKAMKKFTLRIQTLLTLIFLNTNALSQSSLMPPCPLEGFKDKCYAEIKNSNGTKYTGEFANDKADGRGIAVYPNGGKFIGEFSNGMRHGEGTYYFTNGDVYRGQWENGKRNGQGTLSLASGGNKTGIWVDGVLPTSERSTPSNSDTGLDFSYKTSENNCPASARLTLNSSGYSGNIEVQLRKGSRPGSRVIARGDINTVGAREFPGICPGKYFFSFATSDSPTVSVTRYFSIEENTSVARMTVFMSRSNTTGNTVQTVTKKDL